MGYKDCGLIPSVIVEAGGYYMGSHIYSLLFCISSSIGLDVGGSQYIIDGKINLKSGTSIKEFTEGGLTFEDGTQLAADVVIFCTG